MNQIKESTRNFIIDFDSTFTRVEALDILCEISLAGNPDKESVIKQIKALTDAGMSGKMSLTESLSQRLALIKAHKDHLVPLVERLKEKVSISFKRNIEFIQSNKDQIYIVSNGFVEFIAPIVTEYGVKSNHILANSFTFDDSGSIVGFDETNLLSSNEGKVNTIKDLNLEGEVFVIGDGYTDYEIKKAGLAQKFYAFTENVTRDNVAQNADHIAPSLDEILYVNNMNTALSYPKNRIKVLILEGIHSQAFSLFTEEGYEIEAIQDSLAEGELIEKIKDVSILCIRSKTKISKKVLAEANRLMVVGAFCIGTNHIDLEGCTQKGVAVFNAPYSNTRSVVELAIAEIIMLMRNIPERNQEMHNGKWTKSAANSNEIRGKTLGIIGYGNIGSQLSVLAESMGMKVQFYDVQEKLAIGNAQKCQSLNQLLESSDVISLHVDGRDNNTNMISQPQIDKMKDGVILINLSRGHILDLDALKSAQEKGKIRGLGIDVFPEEPASNNKPFQNKLKNSPNTILTPHIGGSTAEAQFNIADYVPPVIMDFINTGTTANSVNLPPLNLPVLENAHRLIHIHHNIPGILASIDQKLAAHEINIVGQYLKTNEIIGYVITDINKEYPKKVIKDLKNIEGTIRVRVLY